MPLKLQASITASWEACFQEALDLHPNARSAKNVRRSARKASLFEKNSRKSLPISESD